MTVVSAQGLKKNTTLSSLFSHRRRRLGPFITVTTFHGGAPAAACDCVFPSWGDKFNVPIDDTFFASRYSCIYLQLFTKRLIAGRSQLGWCQIPAADIGLPPVGSVRQLSYRLRAGDGTRTQGVVNVTVKLEAPVAATATHDQRFDDTCQTVTGIPVSEYDSTCHGNGFPVVRRQRGSRVYMGTLQ